MKRLLILVLFSIVNEIKSTGNLQLIGRQYQKTASDVVEYKNRVRSRSYSNFIIGFSAKNFAVSIETGTDDLWFVDPNYPGIGANQSAYNVK
ncbi:hypothetical protein M3Y98_00784200 [Aphelenchoides besseyi]|nr:hypothetical protein M3Y98_00784200 [Aphelenchoides besseyi]KAI6211866.1 hypothetical protein M3Y96_00479600 [Aphelenchoides besseyi]